MNNFFKSRFGRDSKGGSPARQTSGKSASGESANGPSSPKANVAAMPTSGTDPETCLEVFKSHWLQAVTLMNKVNMAPASGGSRNRAGQEEIEAVRQHIDHLMMLLVEEAGEGSDHHGQGPILQYMLAEDVLEKILTWSSRCSDHQDKLKIQQLKYYDMLISQARQALLIHKPVIRPLLKLLSACAEHTNKNIEKQVILLLHQLCVCVTQDSRLLELLYNASSDHGPAKFLMFSLLIPYVHRDGSIGQQARDALLLIMALSSKHDHIGKYIADNSDFCPVLATGLSGLYSSLPRKLTIPADDWYRLTEEDVNNMNDLVHFLNSLEFCNAVVQVAHPLVKEQLLTFIYNGFLVPVIAPALHQNQDYILKRSTMNEILYSSDDDLGGDTIDDDMLGADHLESLDILKLPISLVESYFANSMEEVIAATAYLEIFIRRITEPALMETFLRFIITEKHDDVPILESLVSRISTHTRLCMVSLSLFWSLIDLNCEDVMFQLIFKHLIPCTHVMVSQRRSVKDVDLYSKAAEKFLSLTPACCVPDASDTPPDGATTPNADNASIASSSPASSVGETPTPNVNPDSVQPMTNKRFNNPFRRRPKRSASELESIGSSDMPNIRSSSPDASPSMPPGSLGTKLEHYETNYMEYLGSARAKVQGCCTACQCWCYPYDGDNPSADILVQSSDSSAADSVASTPVVTPAIEINPFPGDTTPTVETTTPIAEAQPIVSSPQSQISAGDSEKQETPQASKETSSDPPESSSSIQKESDKSEVTDKDAVDKLPVIRDCTKISPVKQDSCADSVISEADSALSGSSSNTETAHNEVEQTGSRSDSPLNDDFGSQDFNAFLLSLKRVKTPVEFCDNIEESIQEFEELLNNLKLNISSRTSTVDRDRSLSDGISDELPKFVTNIENKDLIKPSTSSITDSEGMKVRPASIVSLTEFDKEINKKTSVSDSTPAPITPGPGLGRPSVGTPIKYSIGAPSIGPFLSTLLSKLETMMQNTLYVNLLLTAVITRLACYPQPLLRSFLLNHSLVFQPTVKSLIQVLGSVKHKVDCYSYTVKDFESLMLKARRFLAWREEVYFGDHEQPGRGRSDSVMSVPAVKTPKDTGRKRSGSVLENFLFGSRTKQPPKGRGSQDGRRLQITDDNKGFRYINRQASENNPVAEKMESVKTKNAVYCALVLEEFLKELAAISQEHAVLAADATSDHLPILS